MKPNLDKIKDVVLTWLRLTRFTDGHNETPTGRKNL
jgi:hypothetical protein